MKRKSSNPIKQKAQKIYFNLVLKTKDHIAFKAININVSILKTMLFFNLTSCGLLSSFTIKGWFWTGCCGFLT